MYSMVLMMAMSASPEAAAFGSCTGYSCNGCTGYSSCHGGGGLFKGKSCHGCTGYTYTSCTGCTGYTSCTGCTGYTSCCGCKGGGIFGGMFKGHGCKGSSCQGYTSCCGCTGYTSCTGCTGGVIVTPPKTEPIPPPKKGGVTALPATIVVNVPADAKVTIDGTPTKSTSAVRVFATPELAPGAVYYYTVTAEVVREGKTLTASEKIAVEAGVNSVISLSPTQAPVVASK